MKKYAFMLMGSSFVPEQHTATFEHGNQISSFFTVNNFDMAKQKILQLYQDGYGAVELCGAFSKDMAKELAELTDRKVAIGYMTHDPELDPLFQNFFAKK